MTENPQGSNRSWHTLNNEAALQELEASPQGLDSEAARERLQRYGGNVLESEQLRPAWRRFLDQFNNLLMLILLVAAVASFLLGHAIDAFAIAGVVIIIALIGFIQEGKAEEALAAIRGMLSPKASVLRDGRRTVIPAEELVPGDVVLLESGDRVPADLRLLEARRFLTQEAALTGESLPVEKGTGTCDADTDLAERSNMAFAGTFVVQGNAAGLVVETGSRTQIGLISEMLRGVETLKTPLLRQIDHAGRVLAVFILGAAVLTGLFGVLVHDQPLGEMFMASVGLAVAAIPEGLPAIVTITLALGVQSMARHNAIIRRLPAVETLGSISTIFSDKTGTLTRNEMTAQAIVMADQRYAIDGVGFAPEGTVRRVDGDGRDEPVEDAGKHPLLHDFLLAGVLCSDAELATDKDRWVVHGDPTEGALVAAAAKLGLDARDLRHKNARLDAIPFESERRYMATLHDMEDGRRHLLVKGAPDKLIELCHKVRTTEGTGALDAAAWQQRIEELSAQGLRVLALAEKDGQSIGELADEHAENELVLIGLVGLLDPPRQEAIEAVRECQSAGIRPVMITGDHAVTAQAIARQLGFGQTDRAVTGHELEHMSDDELRRIVLEVDVFARAAPEHKLRLVEALQSHDKVCAMTGDGVNDGPALKRADVGVAMGIQGTEAAKDAAEMVLADDNFATIVNAVREGRKVYDNIRKTITFILPTNGAQGLAIMAAVLLGLTLPVTPLQALWVNMVVAVTLGLALAFEAGEPDLMSRQPRDPAESLLDMFLLWRVIFVSLLLLAAVFGVFTWMLEDDRIELARSGAVNMLVMGCAAYLINSRYLVRSAWSFSAIFGSRPVWISIGVIVALQLLWTYVPWMQMVFGSDSLDAEHWLVILGLSVALFVIVEAEKALWRRRGQ